MLVGDEDVAAVGGDDALVHELQTYALIVIGSHAAIVATAFGSTGPADWNSRDWIWAMSQVHSRTFRVDLEVPAAYGARVGNRRVQEQTFRLLAPFADLLDHDSNPNEVCCEWGVERVVGNDVGSDFLNGVAFVVKASRDIQKGSEAIISYGERSDPHVFMYYGFLLKKTLSTARLCFASCRRGRDGARNCADTHRKTMRFVRAREMLQSRKLIKMGATEECWGLWTARPRRRRGRLLPFKWARMPRSTTDYLDCFMF